MTDTPTVLFVCIKNAGKSQMAAALMRHGYGDAVHAFSAGTHPGSTLNEESVAALEQVGAAATGEHPKLVDPQMLARADLVVLLGPEVQLDTGTTPVQRWVTDEPSHRGIHGMERMRLVRDDIAARVSALADELALRPRV
ncbi:arsenate-mycothiol transferase ArsC [Ornithinimicrobium cryptoxanthini]|uniref:Low molecular weight phosphatase family protein n=1 Tax=Ornithinimicrobium cryptoxanthini TaxID=2934161 RepID=A0ABY4YK01_9MICO|nr:low molecular weight phosphatase family protein [Ornithinimicrobium cryptoxanthini]USQ76653.1 low molecular weight phosphatase family protein [Ornithinimicrobium cryptoxanthini]